MLVSVSKRKDKDSEARIQVLSVPDTQLWIEAEKEELAEIGKETEAPAIESPDLLPAVKLALLDSNLEPFTLKPRLGLGEGRKENEEEMSCHKEKQSQVKSGCDPPSKVQSFKAKRKFIREKQQVCSKSKHDPPLQAICFERGCYGCWCDKMLLQSSTQSWINGTVTAESRRPVRNRVSTNRLLTINKSEMRGCVKNKFIIR